MPTDGNDRDAPDKTDEAEGPEESAKVREAPSEKTAEAADPEKTATSALAGEPMATLRAATASPLAAAKYREPAPLASDGAVEADSSFSDSDDDALIGFNAGAAKESVTRETSSAETVVGAATAFGAA